MVPYLGCLVDGITARRRFVMASVVRKLVCSLTLSCKRRTFFILFSGRTRRIRLFNLCRLATYATELTVVPFFVMPSRITRVSRPTLSGRCMAHRKGRGSQIPMISHVSPTIQLRFHRQQNVWKLSQTLVNISHWFLLRR
jgi:hypothetical protein